MHRLLTLPLILLALTSPAAETVRTVFRYKGRDVQNGNTGRHQTD